MNDFFYKQAPVHFSCTGCGRCCLGHPDENMIELASGELKKISQFLKMGKNDFLSRYGVELENKTQGIAINRQGRCVFLQKNNRCSIYTVRPRQCLTYPYWPEIMVSQAAWDNEVNRCEGINTGKVVKTKHIEKQLSFFYSPD